MEYCPPYECYVTPNKLDPQKIPFYDDFYSKMNDINPLVNHLQDPKTPKSTDYKFYSLFPSDSELPTKVLEYMTSDPSIVFTRKAVANKMFVR